MISQLANGIHFIWKRLEAKFCFPQIFAEVVWC
jgi:hypothetical protein